LYKILFILLHKFPKRIGSYLRKLSLILRGMKIGRGTNIPKIKTIWPHQIQIGNNCQLEDYLFLKFDGIYKPGPAIIIGNNCFIGQNCEFNIRKGIEIGNFALIGSGTKFIDHDHGFTKGILIKEQQGIEQNIIIEDDVWIGCNSIILKGVRIGKGAVIAAGSVVNSNYIPSNEIWGGIPAKKISERK
jgi:acetyltransferase-like isoleucine patch superfamily enzyme